MFDPLFRDDQKQTPAPNTPCFRYTLTGLWMSVLVLTPQTQELGCLFVTNRLWCSFDSRVPVEQHRGDKKVNGMLNSLPNISYLGGEGLRLNAQVVPSASPRVTGLVSWEGSTSGPGAPSLHPLSCTEVHGSMLRNSAQAAEEGSGYVQAHY